MRALFNEIIKKAATWMVARGRKCLTAKSRECVYPERSRRKQSLFEHTMVELDALLSLLHIFRQPSHFHLIEEEEKIPITSIIAHDAGKEKPEWQVIGRLDA